MLKIGDRVRMKETYDGSNCPYRPGEVVTIIAINNGWLQNPIHICTKSGLTWWVPRELCKLVSDEIKTYVPSKRAIKS